MYKYLIRFVAFLLIPCLTADSVRAAEFPLQSLHIQKNMMVFQSNTQNLFSQQTLTLEELASESFPMITSNRVQKAHLFILPIVSLMGWMPHLNAQQPKNREPQWISAPKYNPKNFNFNQVAAKLTSENWIERLNGVGEARLSKNPRFIPLLIQMAENEKDARVRGALAKAFGAFGDKSATSILVRWIIFRVNIGYAVHDAYLESQLTDSAESALTQIKDPDLIPSLIAAMNQGQGIISGTLARPGIEREPVKMQALSALFVLSQSKDPRVIPAFEDAVQNNPDPFIRAAVAYQLASLVESMSVLEPQNAPPARRTALAALRAAASNDPVFEVRAGAVSGLVVLRDSGAAFLKNVYGAIADHNNAELIRLVLDPRTGPQARGLIERASTDKDDYLVGFVKKGLEEIDTAIQSGTVTPPPSGSIRVYPDYQLSENRDDFAESVDGHFDLRGKRVRVHFQENVPEKTKVIARVLSNILDTDRPVGVIKGKNGEVRIFTVNKDHFIEFDPVDSGLPPNVFGSIVHMSAHSKQFAWSYQLGSKNEAAYVKYFEYFPKPPAVQRPNRVKPAAHLMDPFEFLKLKWNGHSVRYLDASSISPINQKPWLKQSS